MTQRSSELQSRDQKILIQGAKMLVYVPIPLTLLLFLLVKGLDTVVNGMTFNAFKESLPSLFQALGVSLICVVIARVCYWYYKSPITALLSGVVRSLIIIVFIINFIAVYYFIEAFRYDVLIIIYPLVIGLAHNLVSKRLRNNSDDKKIKRIKRTRLYILLFGSVFPLVLTFALESKLDFSNFIDNVYKRDFKITSTLAIGLASVIMGIHISIIFDFLLGIFEWWLETIKRISDFFKVEDPTQTDDNG